MLKPFSLRTALTPAKEVNSEFVLFQQVTEAKNGDFAEHHISKCTQAGELAQQRDIVQGSFHRRVEVTEPLLNEVNTEHRSQRHRRTAIAFLGVERINRRLNA